MNINLSNLTKIYAVSFLALLLLSNVAFTNDIDVSKRFLDAIELNKIEDVGGMINEGLHPNKIRSSFFGFSKLPTLDMAKLLLENAKAPMDPVHFIELTLNTDVTRYNLDTASIELDRNQLLRREELIRLATERMSFDPNRLLKIIVYPGRVPDIAKEKIQYKLMELALKEGGNPNNPDVISNALYANNTELLELLFNNPYKKIEEEYFKKFVSFAAEITPDDTPFDSKYKNLEVPTATSPKIPRIIYHIWLTNKERKREISETDLANILRTHKIFLQNGKAWEHTLWTNDKSLIPSSVKKLEENGIKVREISEIKQPLKLRSKIYELIAQEDWGMASDSLRYELLKHYGGVYADVNYRFFRDVEEEIYKYDFVGQQNPNYFLENFFFAATPYHQIFNKTVDTVYDNFYHPKDFFKELEGRTITDVMTHYVPLIAYNSVANGGTLDVIYPNIRSYWLLDPHSSPTLPSIEEMRLEDALKRQKINIIKKHMLNVPNVEKILEKILFTKSKNKNEICGTRQHLIGEDLAGSGASTWVKDE